MDRPQRFLIVGLGSVGKRHLRNLRQLRPDSRIAALRSGQTPESDEADDCDNVFYSLSELEAFRPDAAIIASPAPFHVDVAQHLLERGIPALVEKPLSDRLEGLEDLLSLASAKGVPTMVGYNLRFDPALLEVRRLLQRQEIGEVYLARAAVGQYLPDWRPGLDYKSCVSGRAALGGGPLLELSHELDYLYWLFGMPHMVTCRGGRYSELDIDVEDAVELTLEYVDPRRLVSVGLDFLQRPPKRSCTFAGSRGTLTWDVIAGQVRVERQGGQTPSEEVFSFGKERNQMYVAELEHFLKCVETGETPLIRLEDGAAIMAIVEAARESMRSGTSVSPVGLR